MLSFNPKAIRLTMSAVVSLALFLCSGCGGGSSSSSSTSSSSGQTKFPHAGAYTGSYTYEIRFDDQVLKKSMPLSVIIDENGRMAGWIPSTNDADLECSYPGSPEKLTIPNFSATRSGTCTGNGNSCDVKADIRGTIDGTIFSAVVHAIFDCHEIKNPASRETFYAKYDLNATRS